MDQKSLVPTQPDLVYVTNEKPLTHIFFPMIDRVPGLIEGTTDSRACPTVAATPEATKAAFMKEGDLFSQMGIDLKTLS